MKKYLNKIKLYTFLFRLNKPFLAIPFAVTTAFLVSDGLPDLLRLFGLMLAVFGGFMAGNAFNAITDRKIDKINPRTANRPFACGGLSLKEVIVALFVAIIIVVFGTIIIDWKYLFLLPIPLIFCLGYSISKRYTWLCHAILGITNAICPVASWGIFCKWIDWRLILMGAIVCFWTMGFELIYSSQDVKYDKACGMKSIPSVFGLQFAYRLSGVCHLLMYAMIFLLILVIDCGIIFILGVVIATPLLIYEHLLIKNNEITKPELAFNLNQWYSLIVMFFTMMDNFYRSYI